MKTLTVELKPLTTIAWILAAKYWKNTNYFLFLFSSIVEPYSLAAEWNVLRMNAEKHHRMFTYLNREQLLALQARCALPVPPHNLPVEAPTFRPFFPQIHPEILYQQRCIQRSPLPTSPGAIRRPASRQTPPSSINESAT